MSIGATSTWNHTYLFPNDLCSEDEEDYSTTNIISKSVATWKDVPLSKSISSIHASYPTKEESSDTESFSSELFFQIREDGIKSEDDDYAIVSNDDRKGPAKQAQP